MLRSPSSTVSYRKDEGESWLLTCVGVDVGKIFIDFFSVGNCPASIDFTFQFFLLFSLNELQEHTYHMP